MTKLSGKLPEGSANGLDRISSELVDQPHKIHVVLALVDCKSLATNVDSGEVVPTARIRRVEVVVRDDIGLVDQIMRRALERRTGKQVLPIELEDELRAAFDGVDPHTGEVLNRTDDEE